MASCRSMAGFGNTHRALGQSSLPNQCRVLGTCSPITSPRRPAADAAPKHWGGAAHQPQLQEGLWDRPQPRYLPFMESRGGFSRSAAREEAPGISSNPFPLFPSLTAKIFMSKVDIKI